MNDHEQIDPPDFAPSFAKLAAVLEIGRSQLYEIRLRDPRFPSITPHGWDVVRTGLLLELRRVEKLSPSRFADERRERAGAVLADIEAGRVAFGRRTAAAVAVFKTIMQDFDGSEAQADVVKDLTESITRIEKMKTLSASSASGFTIHRFRKVHRYDDPNTSDA